MSASQDFSWVDKKPELSPAVYLAYLSAVSIDKKNPRTQGKSWRKIDEEACPDVIDCVSSLVQAREAVDPHWFTGSDVIRCGSTGGPHWSAVRRVLEGLVSSYLQAGLEKCPLEKMTPLKGAENSRLTAIPLFSHVTSNPAIRKSQSLCILLFWIFFQRTISQSCNILT